MFKIGILFEDREFEHDIYELIRAFYPGSEIHSFYEKEEEACDLFFKISKQVDSCVISYENAETKGVTSAEFIKGSLRMPLFLVQMQRIRTQVYRKNGHMQYVKNVKILSRLLYINFL